jgi:hypothetical protein
MIHVGASATPDTGTTLTVTTGGTEIYVMPVVLGGMNYFPFSDSWLIGAKGEDVVISCSEAGAGVTTNLWVTEGR